MRDWFSQSQEEEVYKVSGRDAKEEAASCILRTLFGLVCLIYLFVCLFSLGHHIVRKRFLFTTQILEFSVTSNLTSKHTKPTEEIQIVVWLY